MWKKIIPIGGGKYKADLHGNIFGQKGNKLSTETSNRGYLRVQICQGGICKKYSVHRLVLLAFYGGSKYELEVNHIDGIKTNNRLSNLEWCTRGENLRHAREVGLRNISNNVIQLDSVGNIIKIWKNTSDIVNQLGLHQCAISKCCLGKQKTSGGFMWKYV